MNNNSIKREEKLFFPKHLLKIVKTTILLFFIGVFLAQATNIQSQEAKLTLKEKSSSIISVCEAIEKESDYRFIFTGDAKKVAANKMVDLIVEEKDIEEVLKIILFNTELEYSKINNQIVIYKDEVTKSVTDSQHKPSIELSQQQKKQIRGTIVDENGVSIIGANIVEIGTNNGTVSDIEGNFTLYVEENARIRITYIGYLGREISIGDREHISIILKEDTQSLDEVVVTGIFNRARESFTGAANIITTEELQEVGNRSILSSIQNIDPSFNILQNINIGSDPNALPSITIRGSSSLTTTVRDLQEDQQNMRDANQPLFIMDGFEISLSRFMDLDENQIESYTLLKDNSATSLYGSRGANGVVVLTSKRPKQGKLLITYNANLNIEAPDLTSYSLMNSQEKLAFEKASGLYESINANMEQEMLDLYNKRKIEAERGVDTYWLKYPVRTGVGQRHSLRLEGGDDAILYSAGLSYDNIVGTMKGSDRNNFNGSVYLQYRLSNIIFQNDLQISSNKSYNSPYGTFLDYSKINAYLTPYDNEGNLVKVLEDYTYNNISRMDLRRQFVYNPLYNAMLPQRNEGRYTQITNNFSTEWSIAPELTFRGRLSVSSQTNRSDRYISAKDTMFDNYIGEDFIRKGIYAYGTGNSLNYDADLTLNYNNIFADKHNLFVGLGYNIAENTSESYSITAEGISNINMDFLGMAGYYQKGESPSGSENITRRVGGVATANYTYDNRYFADFSGRLEGSSRFGANNRYAPFWSVGAGWNMHQESFLSDSQKISVARVRLSYGTSGSQNFSPYQSITTFRTNTANSYRNWHGVYLMGLGNEDLGWQTTHQVNFGADLELFERRFRFNFDIYNKHTSNLLSDVNLPSSGGFNTYRANVGNVLNKGFEVSLNAFILQNRSNGLSWSVGGSLIHNKNQIAEISNSLQFLNEQLRAESNINPSFMFEEGESINTIYAVKSKGIDPSNGKEIFIKADGTETYTWDPRDKTAVGINEPKFFGNLNTTFRYKGFSINAVFGYRYGGQMYNSTLVSKVENITPYDNADKRAYYDRWKEPGDLVFFKSVKDFLYQTNASSRFVMDENTLDLRSLSLGYEVPVSWLKKHNLPIEYLSIRGYGEDLFHLSSIKLERGLNYPYSRKFSMALTVRF